MVSRVSTPLRRRLRRLRRLLGYGLASLLILAALAVAIANQFMPLLQRHPDDVAQWLSERLGRRVAIEAVQARWNRRGPLLSVQGLQLGEGAEAIDIGRAELQVNAYSGLLPGMPLTELRVRGVDLELTRAANGTWQLEGLSTRPDAEPVDLRQLDGLGEVQIAGATLQFRDQIQDRDWTLRRIDARLRTVGTRFRVGVVAHIDDGAPLQLVAQLDRELHDGEVWIGGRSLTLAPWLNGLPLAGIEAIQADGDLDLWLTVKDRQVQEGRIEARLSPLTLRGRREIALDAQGDDTVEARYGLDQVEAALRWQRNAAGWSVDIARLDMDAGDARTALSGVRIERDEGLRLRAPEVEIAPLLAMAMLSERVPAGLRRWLYLAAPRGRLLGLELHWRDAAQFRLDGRLESGAWLASRGAPGIEGLSGLFQADAQALSLRLESQTVRFEAPGVLRAPFHPVTQGSISAFRLDPGWRIEVAGLQLHEPDYSISVDGGIELQGDGSKPLLDLRADVQAGPVTAAKRFWVVNKMPPKAVQWLDDALIAGRLLGGRALVRGDADFWPFREHEGRFEAQAELAGLDLRYRHDWPPGHEVSGSARFINDGIELDLSGRILGNRIERTTGGIASLRDPVLELDTRGGGGGEDLLALLRASPLQQRYGDYLTGLRVGGEGAVDLKLHIPLRDDLGEPQVEGTVDLDRADLDDRKWNLAFEGATGRVRFSHRGFAADELRVAFAQAPATLSIAVGDYTSVESRSAEASLRGRFAADALLDAYPTLHWVKPWIEGESEWNLQLNVSRDNQELAAAQATQELRVHSDLVGSALSFPAPLRKDATDALGLDLAVALPLQAGGIDLRLGELMRLRGRLRERVPFAGVASFGDVPEEDLPERGLVAVGQVPVLDAAGWAAFALSGHAGEGGLQRADLHAGELDVLDRAFAETRLSFSREPGGDFALGFAGEVLQGKLDIPTTDIATRGITARFERLHWPSRAPRADSALSHADPALIPPLHLSVDDFRFGDAQLGETRLETYPTPEGMHVEKLDTTSSDLTLRASGDWTRIAGRERSNFRIAFDAGDLGAMLGALGFSKLIEGGATRAELQATWPGAPSAFELQRIDGRLSATVGKGRVLEVNPGAGRIFGLLSLTEIPRRLALDFSDFFKSGLAFNEITGSFSLDGGNAYTDDLRIDGPAAEIRVRGRTGLKARDYDQTMEVLPRAGSVLPALGAIAAGPAGAALGAVAQAVLQQPIKQMARTVYRVQGGWAEPDINVIERGPARAEGNAGREVRDDVAVPQSADAMTAESRRIR